MKKSTIGIIILEVILIIVVIGYNTFGIGQPKNIENVIQRELKGNEQASLNYLLKYEMPSGYEEAIDLTGEISIREQEGNSMFTAEPVLIEQLPMEQFFQSQEYLFSSAGTYNIISEVSTEEKDRTITKKIYEVSNDFVQLYALIGTIQFKDNPNEYIGIVGNSTSQDYEKDLDTLLNSINYTKQTIDKEKLYSNDLENVKITIPGNWKRLERAVPYSFYKQDENNIAYIIASSMDKQQEDSQENYDYLVESFTQEDGANLIEDRKAETVGNKTITNTTIEYEGTNTTTILTLIEFSNSNIYTIVRFDIVSEEGIDYIKPEIDSIINSIELK